MLMNGEGRIDVYMTEKQDIYIDIKDTGKGIARKNFKTVFNPGTRPRNGTWTYFFQNVLEDYHAGRIYVKKYRSRKRVPHSESQWKRVV